VVSIFSPDSNGNIAAHGDLLQAADNMHGGLAEDTQKVAYAFALFSGLTAGCLGAAVVPQGSLALFELCNMAQWHPIGVY